MTARVIYTKVIENDFTIRLKPALASTWRILEKARRVLAETKGLKLTKRRAEEETLRLFRH